MINIDDLLDNIEIDTYDKNDEFAVQQATYNTAHSEKLPLNISNGGAFLKMVCDDNTFDELLSRARKIKGEKNKYEFYFGELPSLRYSKKTKVSDQYNTLRIYIYLGNEFAEYCEPKNNFYYIMPFSQDKYVLSIQPIRWIIDIDKRKIISSQVYDMFNIPSNTFKTYINQKKFTDNELITVKNSFFDVENGIVRKVNFKNWYHPKWHNILIFPENIVAIEGGATYYSGWRSDNITSPSVYFNRKLERMSGYYYLSRCSLFTNVIIDGSIKINDFYFDDSKRHSSERSISLHYASFIDLYKFVFNESPKISVSEYNKTPFHCTIYGPRLSKREKRIIRSFELFKNFKWKPEKNDSYVEKKEEHIFSDNEKLDIEIEEHTFSDNEKLDIEIEDVKDENNIKKKLEKIFNYLKYYPNGEKEIEKTCREIAEYNEKIARLENAYLNHETIFEDPEQLHNEKIIELDEKLETLEKNSEFFKVKELIKKSIQVLNGNVIEDNNDLIIDLTRLTKEILLYLKERYQKHFTDQLISFFYEEEKKVDAYLIDGNSELSYTNEEEFEIYFRTLFHPILYEIKLALNDEMKRRDIAEEIRIATFKTIEYNLQKAKLTSINHLLDTLNEITNSLNEKISTSPFSEEFNNDKNKIYDIVNKIDDYYDNPNLKEILFSNCSTIKKYLIKNDSVKDEINKLFEKINLHNEHYNDEIEQYIIRAYQLALNIENESNVERTNSGNDDTSIYDESNKMINALWLIIHALDSLELEVEDSINKKEVFTRCKIKI